MSAVAVLVIAGSDSSGGAGVTRDVAVLRDFGFQARCAITSVTAQSHDSWRTSCAIPPEVVRAQILAACDSGQLAAVKIGMLGNAATVQAVVESLPPRAAVPIVLDPVLASSSGARLLDEAGRYLLRSALLPRVTLLTPNIPEAAELLDSDPAADEAALLRQAQRLLQLGPQAILLKGGHAGGATVTDLLLTSNGEVVRNSVPRVDMDGRAADARGTGCALSTAIAAGLAAGHSLAQACHDAQRYLLEQLQPG